MARRFTKFLVCAAATAMLSTLSLTATAGKVLDRVMDSGQLVVATSASWPPHAFLNEDHELAGFDVDVAKQIAKRMGVKVKFDTPSFDIITAGHWQNRWDLASYSITPTTARSKALDFPAVYYYSTYVFVVHKDSDAKTRADLKDAVFGVEGGTTADQYLHQDLDIDGSLIPKFEYLKYVPKKIVTYDKSIMPFDDLRLGDGVRLDAILAEQQTAKNAIKHGYPVRILPDDVAFQEPIALATDLGDPEFDQKIADIIQDMRDDGTLKKISMKWFKADFTKLAGNDGA